MIHGYAEREHNGAYGAGSYFGSVFGGFGNVTVTATTVVNTPMNSGGFGALEYRYLNTGATAGSYRLQVRLTVPASCTMYVATTLTGHAFAEITED